MHLTIFRISGGDSRPSSRPSSGQSEEDTNIVDKLLGDIRGGFTHKLGGMSEFSVTKVQKVHLDGDVVSSGNGEVKTPEGEFTRNGSFRNSRRGSDRIRLQVIEESSPDSKRSDDQQNKDGRTRRSTELEGSNDLFDYLLQVGADDDKPATFERSSSLRRSRRRRANPVEQLVGDRERAPSPNTLEVSSSTTHPKSVAAALLERRTSTRSLSPPASPARPISPLISGEIRSRPGSASADDKNRWSTSSNETQADDELARERHRRRLERGKKHKLDLSRAVNGTYSDTDANSPIVTDNTSNFNNTAMIKTQMQQIPSESNSQHASENNDASGKNDEETPTGPPRSRERRPSKQLLRSRSHLDAEALASALRTVEQHSQRTNADDDAVKSELSPSEAALERNKARLSRRNQNIIEPNVVSDVLKHIEGVNQITKDQNDNEAKSDVNSQNAGYGRESVTMRRGSADRSWRNSRTDIDNVIQDIEKTSQEIQMLGSTQDLQNTGVVDQSQQKAERSNSKSWLNRRWRSNVDKSEVIAALSKIPSNTQKEDEAPPVPPRTTSKIRSSMESVSQATSHDNLAAVHGRSRSYSDRTVDGTPIQRMKEGGESITEKALLDHTSGRWRSNIETTDVQEAFDRMNSPPIVHISSSASDLKSADTMSSPSRSRRPLSVYDNVLHSHLEDIPEKSVPKRKEIQSLDTNNSSQDLNTGPEVSPITKRWGRFIDDKESSELNRSVSISSIPLNSSHHDASRRWSAAVESSEINNILNNEQNNIMTPKGDDAGYHSLDRGSRLRRSARFSSLRAKKSETSPESVTSVYTSRLRHDAESEELDNKVHHFQNTVPETTYMRRKEKLKAISQRYDDDDWSKPTKPTENRQYEQPAYSTPINSVHSIPDGPPGITSLEQRISLTDDGHLPKSDFDSIPQDEGFETESMSDPNASQRTSMSSTLESELAGTPTMGRKEYPKQKEIEESEENKSNDAYFARSLDSLVQKQDLAFSEAKPDEEDSLRSFNDKTPTMEDNSRLELWSGTQSSDSEKDKTVTNTPEEDASEEVWTTVTVERKFSDMTKEEQQVI